MAEETHPLDMPCLGPWNKCTISFFTWLLHHDSVFPRASDENERKRMEKTLLPFLFPQCIIRNRSAIRWRHQCYRAAPTEVMSGRLTSRTPTSALGASWRYGRLWVGHRRDSLTDRRSMAFGLELKPRDVELLSQTGTWSGLRVHLCVWRRGVVGLSVLGLTGDGLIACTLTKCGLCRRLLELSYLSTIRLMQSKCQQYVSFYT